MILISFVIPVFNNVYKIQKTLNSISKLDALLTEDYEVVVVDDGSTDPVSRDDFVYKNAISIIHNSSNSGPLHARLFGGINARGKYIYFVDCGDEIINDSFASIIKDLKVNESDIFVVNTIEKQNNKQWTIFENMPEGKAALEQILLDIIRGTAGFTSSLIFKSDIIGDIFAKLSPCPKYIFTEDSFLALVAVDCGHSYFYTNKIFYLYNREDSSLSRSIWSIDKTVSYFEILFYKISFFSTKYTHLYELLLIHETILCIRNIWQLSKNRESKIVFKTKFSNKQELKKIFSLKNLFRANLCLKHFLYACFIKIKYRI